MRILHVTPVLEPAAGGPVFALLGVVQAQIKVGLDVRVVAAYHSGGMLPSSHVLEEEHVEIIPIGPVYTSLGWRFDTRKLLRPLIQESDIVHIHTVWEDIQHQAAVLCRRLHKPYVFHPCGMLDVWALNRKSLKKNLYWKWRLHQDLQHAIALHVATVSEHDQVAQLGLRPPVIIAPNGVFLTEFEKLPPRGEFRKKHPELLGHPLIVFLGRVYPGKGIEMLIPALAKLEDRSTMLAVVGPDSTGYGAPMKALARELGVEDRVVFTGMARGRDRIEALVDADLFSLPSEHENFGVSVLEAMAAGTPVVVSDHVALFQDIAHAQVGEAVPLDVDRLADALNRWMKDPELRRITGERARKVALEQYTWRSIARRWAEIYTELAITAAKQASVS
jgi:glycosyltransferase involved in cell wall biosynthesis